MNTLRQRVQNLSHMQAAALAALALLVGAAAWQSYGFFSAKDQALTAFGRTADTRSSMADDSLGLFEAISGPHATSSTPEEIAQLEENVTDQLIANYTLMKDAGVYDDQSAAALGGSMAGALRVDIARPIYAMDDFTTTSDTSAARITRYQKDMTRALAPLKPYTDSELGLIAQYVQAHDPDALQKLRDTATAYQHAAENAATVTVPVDALRIHTDGLNALQEYGAALSALAAHADDPITAATLLLSYNQAEDDLRAALTAYTTYYAKKQ